MTDKKIKKLFLIPIFLIPISVYGQLLSPELISSSGESNVNSSFQLDWSIGELAIEPYSKNEYKLTQGFHQSDLKITTATEILGTKLICDVFPNPATKTLCSYNCFIVLVSGCTLSSTGAYV